MTNDMTGEGVQAEPSVSDPLISEFTKTGQGERELEDMGKASYWVIHLKVSLTLSMVGRWGTPYEDRQIAHLFPSLNSASISR
jgi:hypothetical protein